MRALKFLTFILLLTPIMGVANATYTLKDVIDACPMIADNTPSLLCAPCAGKAIRINEKVYEVRLVTFEQKGVAQADTPKFKDFIAEWQQMSILPQQRQESLIPTDYFSATPQMKEKGFSFLISLREVTDPKLLAELKTR